MVLLREVKRGENLLKYNLYSEVTLSVTLSVDKTLSPFVLHFTLYKVGNSHSMKNIPKNVA